ncbi:MAG: hypothetical protein HYZ37_18130 [Candidatus Solibacter usitatus]|nr:hypothetical protein [Candidatus Solibacter usitatus]
MKLLILFAAVLNAEDPVRMQPYRQAQVAFAVPKDPAILKALAGWKQTATAAGGATWTISNPGVWREDPNAPALDRKRYFASRRWLPSDQATALAPGADGGMWVQTTAGAAHISFPRMTLQAKADVFERRVEERHNRHGMVASSRLRESGNLSSNFPVSSDNDGLWTAMYGAAECFRYAASKSPEALQRARRSVEALFKLEAITGRPGLPARSYILPSEPRPRDGVWYQHPSQALLWKGDTSSDEIVGYYYLFSIAHDLIPDAKLRKSIEAVVRRMTDHILEHGLTLTDIHGQPTYWGRWDQEYFSTPRGKADVPLNTIEILSFLKVAHHITGDARYNAEYRRLALAEGYAKMSATYNPPQGRINYSDEELAMLSFYPLLVYEKDPALRSLYHQALDQWWNNMQREKNPLWIFIRAAANPASNAPLRDAVWTLQRIPMDLLDWKITNSHRPEIAMRETSDRFGRRESKDLLPPDERPTMKWNGNPFRVDSEGQGLSEDDGAFFLLPYWMGRYHRFLLGQ